MRKQILILTAAIAFCATAQTQSEGNAQNDSTIADRLNASGKITVVQPIALNDRLRHSGNEVTVSNPGEQPAATPTVRTGFRVQVFSDNNARTAKHNAQTKKRLIEARFPGVRAYVTFQAPYWRVRVGDFRSRAEAETAMADIRAAFPKMSGDLRIVKERINYAQ